MLSIATRVNTKQQQQKVNRDANRKLREFNIGDTVYIRNFRGTFQELLTSVVVQYLTQLS